MTHQRVLLSRKQLSYKMQPTIQIQFNLTDEKILINKNAFIVGSTRGRH